MVEPKIERGQQEERVPLDYVPYRVLDLCGNHFNDVQFLIEIDRAIHPLLIGQGPFPLVWISAPVGADGRRRWVVERNVSQHRAVDVRLDRENLAQLGPQEPVPIVRVFFGPTLCLEVIARSQEHAIVSTLDLRPFGLNVHGTTERLLVGNSTFENNMMTGARVAFGFG